MSTVATARAYGAGFSAPLRTCAWVHRWRQGGLDLFATQRARPDILPASTSERAIGKEAARIHTPFGSGLAAWPLVGRASGRATQDRQR
jgi:hypothetical protein